MVPRKIEVDDEVFAYLQSRSEPLVDTPNTVLRRLLFDPQSAMNATVPGVRKEGGLAPLLVAGLVEPGDALQHHQPRKQRTHEARITEDGWIETSRGESFAQPSPALKSLVGGEINGWGQWIHVPSGLRLQVLRERAAGKGQL